MPPARAVAILGNDAVLAARPATAVQLAHACLRAGFETTIPASWGDELVAAESVRQLGVRGEGGAILCACPHVEAALLAPGDDLAPLLLPVVAPPVAAARYLRHVLGDTPLRITYIGRCPSASADPAIDVQLSPAAFLRQLAERGIVLADQPTVFDSVLPPDRRRHCSLPGGAPAPSCLWEGERTRTLIEIESEEYKSELAQHLIAHRRAVIDLAPRLGCACSGAVGTATQASARAGVMSAEPPRAAHPVVEAPAELQLSRRIVPRSPVQTQTHAPAHSPVRAPETSATATVGGTPSFSRSPAIEPTYQPPREATRSAESSRKSTPSGPFRVYTGHVPTTRSAEGRSLPRAYAAHRKTPPGTRAVVNEPAPPEPRQASSTFEAPNAASAPPMAHAGTYAESPLAPSAPAAPPPPAPPPSTDSERPIEIVRETVVERTETVQTFSVESPRDERKGIDAATTSSASEAVADAAAGHESVAEVNVERFDEEDEAEDDPRSSSSDEVQTEAHEEEPAVRRASATLITHASTRQATSSIVALVRARSIDTYRQPTAFRLPWPRDPRSFAVVGLTVLVAAVLAVSAIRAVRAPDDDREESTAAPLVSSPLGAARADAATLPPAGAGPRADRPATRFDGRASIVPPAGSPPPSSRAGRPATPAAPTRPRGVAAPTPRRARGERTSAPAIVPAESTAAPTATAAGPRPAPAESTARSSDSAAAASAPPSVAPVVPAPAAAPQGLTAAERDSIQREITTRRARADSIQRRIDSMRTP